MAYALPFMSPMGFGFADAKSMNNNGFFQPQPFAQRNIMNTTQIDFFAADAKSTNDRTYTMPSRPINSFAAPTYKQEYQEEKEENDNDDYDSDNVYDEDQLRFFQDIVDGRRRLDGDDPYWEMKAELSSNLGRLFGKQAKYRGDESYWERPQSYGLGNSAPIIATKFNAVTNINRMAEPKLPAFNGSVATSKSYGEGPSATTRTLYDMVQERGVTFDEALKSNNIRSVVDVVPTNRDADEEEYDEDDGEYYDEEEDYDEEEEVLGGLMSSTGLSPNLMALLGMQVTKVELPTDWKPPDHAGLDNSDPLIRRG